MKLERSDNVEIRVHSSRQGVMVFQPQLVDCVIQEHDVQKETKRWEGDALVFTMATPSVDTNRPIHDTFARLLEHCQHASEYTVRSDWLVVRASHASEANAWLSFDTAHVMPALFVDPAHLVISRTLLSASDWDTLDETM